MKTLLIAAILLCSCGGSEPEPKTDIKMPNSVSYLVDDTLSSDWIVKQNRIASIICHGPEYHISYEKLPHYKAEVSISCDGL